MTRDHATDCGICESGRSCPHHGPATDRCRNCGAAFPRFAGCCDQKCAASYAAMRAEFGLDALDAEVTRRLDAEAQGQQDASDADEALRYRFLADFERDF